MTRAALVSALVWVQFRLEPRDVRLAGLDLLRTAVQPVAKIAQLLMNPMQIAQARWSSAGMGCFSPSFC